MNDIKIFRNEEFGELTVVKKDETLFFNLEDVGFALGYVKKSKGKTYLRKDRLCNIIETLEITTVVHNGQRFIDEEGLYDFILESRVLGARKFRKWITSEILPTIRKTGGYVHNSDLFINTYLPFADDNTKVLFKQTLSVIEQQNKLIEEQKPKVEYFNDLVDRKLLLGFRETTKELKVPERKFMNFLEDEKFIYRDAKRKPQPFAQYVPELFEIKEWKNEHKAGQQILITPKGRETFRLLTEHLKK